MKIIHQVTEAHDFLKSGKIIAYPTEAVYGLGCAAFNQDAVEDVLRLKQRPMHKGLILLIADWSQLTPLIATISPKLMDAVRATWPGPVTWVFPKAPSMPDWLSGEHDGIAIRMTAHPIARALCADEPLVSTSANINGQNPAMNLADLYLQFPRGIDAVVIGDLGGLNQPSDIYDVRTGARLR